MGWVFVDVDVQNDFCHERGALLVPGSPNELYRELTRRAQRDQIPILGSVDSHAFDAWEFASNDRRGPHGEKPNFPDHCVKGSWGWLKVDGTLPGRFRFVPEAQLTDPGALALELARGESQGLYFEKEVYSLFANPNAEPLLRSFLEALARPATFVVFGVATDYCVRAAVLGLCERGYDTVVLEEAIRGITAEGSAQAVAEMKSAGARLISMSELSSST